MPAAFDARLKSDTSICRPSCNNIKAHRCALRVYFLAAHTAFLGIEVEASSYLICARRLPFDELCAGLKFYLLYAYNAEDALAAEALL